MSTDFHFYHFRNEINVTIFFIARIAEQRVAEKSSLLGVSRGALWAEPLTMIEMKTRGD